jgi:hypothetical protein
LPAALPTPKVKIATPRNTGIMKSKRRIMYRKMLAKGYLYPPALTTMRLVLLLPSVSSASKDCGAILYLEIFGAKAQ